MREAVIVSTARTPIGKAYRGAFNNTEAPTLGGHAVRHAVERAGLDPVDRKGFVFNPLSWSWSISPRDLSVNYVTAAVRPQN